MTAPAGAPLVVGLDIATRTGWCRWTPQEVSTGTLDCTPADPGEPEGVRYHRLAVGVRPLLTGAEAVVLEQPFSRGMRTAQVLGGLTAAVLVVLEELGLEYAFVPAPQLKKLGAEHGARGKEEMRRRAAEELARDVSSDEADAYWLARYWWERMRLPM